MKVSGITNHSISLHWAKPTEDGGIPISTYVVKYAANDSDDWQSVKTRQANITVDNLSTGTMYEFHVAAQNEAGIGQTETIGPITARDITSLPEADASSLPNNRILNIKEGSQLDLVIPVSGKPKPTVSWTKERIPLKRT